MPPVEIQLKADRLLGLIEIIWKDMEEQELKNAQPDFPAVNTLSNYAATGPDAAHFAAELKLQTPQIALEK